MSKYLKQLSGQMRPQDDFGRALDEQRDLALAHYSQLARIAQLEKALRIVVKRCDSPFLCGVFDAGTTVSDDSDIGIVRAALAQGGDK